MRTILLMAALAAPALAAEIKLRGHPDAGKSVLVRLESRQEIDSTVKDATGKELKREQRALSEVQEYALAVEEEKDGFPAKFSHEYSKAEQAAGKEKRTLPWSGRKMLFTLAKGKLDAKPAEGKALSAVAGEELVRMVSTRFLDSVNPLLPRKEVKAGEEWTVEPKQAASGLRVPIIEGSSTATGKLLKTYEKDGRRFGVLEMRADLALKLPDGGKGKLEYAIKIDAAIDGKATQGTFRADVTITGSQEVEDKGAKRVLGGTTRGTVSMEVGEQK